MNAVKKDSTKKKKASKETSKPRSGKSKTVKKTISEKKGDATESTPVLTEFVCIIDRSGSMCSIEDDAIGGFNKFLEDQQALPGEAKLTMVLFDNKYEVVHDGVPISQVEPLTKATYVPRGTTALFDAIGRTIASVRSRYESGKSDPARIMVVILTDGQENASREYTRSSQIRELINTCQNDLKWAFMYLSASDDAFTDGTTIGVSPNHVMRFSSTRCGGQSISRVYGSAAIDYRSRGSISDASTYARQADPTGEHLSVSNKKLSVR